MVPAIDIIFHILNTALLLAALFYIFKKYIYGRIFQNMIMSQAAYSNLVKRNEQLRKQEQGLVRAYYHQNYRYEELSHKVELWNQKVEVLKQEQVRESEIVMQALHRRAYHQHHSLQALYECNHVINTIMSETPHELCTGLSVENEQSYTHNLIRHITQEKSPHE
jgi:hypothetical protein